MPCKLSSSAINVLACNLRPVTQGVTDVTNRRVIHAVGTIQRVGSDLNIRW